MLKGKYLDETGYKVDQSCHGMFYKRCILKTLDIINMLQGSGLGFDGSDASIAMLSDGTDYIDYASNPVNNDNNQIACELEGGEFMYKSFAAECVKANSGEIKKVILVEWPRCYAQSYSADVDAM
jgi:hypothetical protein